MNLEKRMKMMEDKENSIRVFVFFLQNSSTI
jgi:hypothetical protein